MLATIMFVVSTAPVPEPNANPKIAIATTYSGPPMSSAPFIIPDDLIPNSPAALNWAAYGAPMVAAYYAKPQFSSFAAKIN